MPEHKDVVTTVLGASVGLAGLLLVFSGFIFSQAASFPSEISNEITNRYTKVAKWAVYPFIGFLLLTILLVGWMIWPNELLYIICISLFLVLIVGTGIYGIVVTHWYL